MDPSSIPDIARVISPPSSFKEKTEIKDLILKCLKIARSTFINLSFNSNDIFFKDMDKNTNKIPDTTAEIEKNINSKINNNLQALFQHKNAYHRIPILADAIYESWKGKESEAEFLYFTRIAFPSFFGYFISSELATIGGDIILDLAEKDTDFTKPFLFSYFLACFHFIQYFYDSFYQELNKFSFHPSIFAIRNLFINILEDSLHFIPISHVNVIVSLLTSCPDIFLHFFFKDFLLHFFDERFTEHLQKAQFERLLDVLLRDQNEISSIMMGRKIPIFLTAEALPQFGYFDDTSSDVTDIAPCCHFLMSQYEINLWTPSFRLARELEEKENQKILSKEEGKKRLPANFRADDDTHQQSNLWTPFFFSINPPKSSTTQVDNIISIPSGGGERPSNKHEIDAFREDCKVAGLNVRDLAEEPSPDDTVEVRKGKKKMQKEFTSQQILGDLTALRVLNKNAIIHRNLEIIRGLIDFYQGFHDQFIPSECPSLGIDEDNMCEYIVYSVFEDYDQGFVRNREPIIDQLATRAKRLEVMSIDEGYRELSSIWGVVANLLDQQHHECALPIIALIGEKANSGRFYQLLEKATPELTNLSPYWEAILGQYSVTVVEKDQQNKKMFLWGTIPTDM